MPAVALAPRLGPGRQRIPSWNVQLCLSRCYDSESVTLEEPQLPWLLVQAAQPARGRDDSDSHRGSLNISERICWVACLLGITRGHGRRL